MSTKPLDVWMKFTDVEDEEPEYEANTYKVEGRYEIEFSHVDVGQVVTMKFDTLEAAHTWYEDNGFSDFST